MNETLTLFFSYNCWATAQLLTALSNLPTEHLHEDHGLGVGPIWKLLSHLIAAEEVWIRRIQHDSPTALTDYTALPDLDAMGMALQERQGATLDCVAGLSEAELRETLSYRTTKGVEYHMPVWQVLLHLANHATDHRSQIGAAMNHFGVPGPQIDPIYFLRSQPS